MRKGKTIKKGICLECRRYFPPASNSCVIAKENVKECEFYLPKIDPVPASPVVSSPITSLSANLRKER